ncbi:hypothetical protein PSPO01_06616 [Paraphaeosphaeria sporulosa]
MPSCISRLKRVWKKFVRCCGFGQSRWRKKPVENIQLQEVHATQANTEPRSKSLRGTGVPYRQVPSSCTDENQPAAVVPAIAHLGAKETPHGSRLAFFRREVVGEEPLRRDTTLLADRKTYAKRAVTDSPHHSNNSDDDEDDDDGDLPVANFLPRGYKLQHSDSRNHLRIVRKSALSPLNGCDQAPPNQKRRTPAPFMMPVHETQGSISEVASKYFRSVGGTL